MTLLALPWVDEFDRADSSTVGNNWDESADPARFDLLGGECRLSLAGGDGFARWMAQTGGDHPDTAYLEAGDSYFPTGSTNGRMVVALFAPGATYNENHIAMVDVLWGATDATVRYISRGAVHGTTTVPNPIGAANKINVGVYAERDPADGQTSGWAYVNGVAVLGPFNTSLLAGSIGHYAAVGSHGSLGGWTCGRVRVCRSSRCRRSGWTVGSIAIG